MKVQALTQTFEIPLKKEEVLKILRVSMTTLDRAMATRKIGWLKMGHDVRFTAEQVQAYLDRQVYPPKAPLDRKAKDGES